METLVLRVRGVSKAHQGKWENLAREVVLEPMGPVECLENLDLRVTEVLMGFQACPVRRDTGVRTVLLVPMDLPERMDQGEKMERLDQEDLLVRAGREVCSALEALLDLLDNLALLVLMVHRVPKETWDPRESRALLVNRESQEHRVFQVHRAPLDHLEKKVLREGLVCLDCLAQMDLLVILVKRVHLERKELWASSVPRAPSAILALAV